MDITKLLKGVRTLDAYIKITQDLKNAASKQHCAFNMSAVLSLKSIVDLEIEYFNKFNDYGAAFLLMKHLMTLPPSSTWRLLGNELVSVIRCWITAVKITLLAHHHQWWSFFWHLLNFIKEIQTKDKALNNSLVKEVAVSLLDLATDQRLSEEQKHIVLYTLNLFSSGSSRETRLEFRPYLHEYFIKLSRIMATSGYLPMQYSILEMLVRWLLPRQDLRLRHQAAKSWFSGYQKHVVDIFLERPWADFFQDARDFLNALNQNGDMVTSAVCKKLSVGRVELITGNERRRFWLDINVEPRSLSMLLDPGMVGVQSSSFVTLIVTREDALNVQLLRESVGITLLVTTVDTPKLFPSPSDVFDERDREVRTVISSRSDMAMVDNALRAVFDDKYQVQLDFNNLTMSPVLPASGPKIHNGEEETRFSIALGSIKPERERRRIGYIARARNFSTPSTTSTTSLAQLHDKLAALPAHRFNRVPIGVCAPPELSVVNEDDESCSTLLLRHVDQLSYKTRSRQTQSDGEAASKNARFDKDVNFGRCADAINKTGKRNSGVPNQIDRLDDASSSLLESCNKGPEFEAINNIFFGSRLETPNVLDSLLKKAEQTEKISESNTLNSDANTGHRKNTEESNDAIDDTAYTLTINNIVDRNRARKANCTVISKSTSDESNTEHINETQISYVNIRKRNLQRKKSACVDNIEKNSNVPDDFFAQHLATNKPDDVAVSPTLARKINATSSENSEDFDCNKQFDGEEQFHFNLDDVIECLNSMVDKVCKDFEKSTNYFKCRDTDIKTLNTAKNTYVENFASNNLPLKNIGNTFDEVKNNETHQVGKAKKTETKKRQNLKRKYNTKKVKAPKVQVIAKNELASKLPPIIEANVEINESSPNKKANFQKRENKLVKGITSRKRKLYSPKDDHVMRNASDTTKDEKNAEADAERFKKVYSDSEDDLALSEFKKSITTPKLKATCYKELEKDRQIHKRIRARKSKASTETVLSPKTKKLNDVFDNLKDNIESNEKIILADYKSNDKDMGIFNFTSDSEDDQFEKKKNEIQKRISTTTVDSKKSLQYARRGRQTNIVDYTDVKNTVDKANKKAHTKRKKVVKRQNSKSKFVKMELVSVRDLQDERIRAAPPDMLDTSLDALLQKDKHSETIPDPNILEPQVEIINDENSNNKLIAIGTENNSYKKTERKPVKKNKVKQALDVTRGGDDDRTISPLPGLVVEMAPIDHNKGEDSLTSKLALKLKKIYQEGPDTSMNETNTTQNLLSVSSYSPQIKITEESNTTFDVPNKTNIENSKASRNILKSKANSKTSGIKETIKIIHDGDKSKQVSANNSKSTFKRNKMQLNKQKGLDQSGNTNLMEVTWTENSKTKYKTVKNKNDEPLKRTGMDTYQVKDNHNTTKTSTNKSSCIVNISDVTDAKSEKSFSSEGITGRGVLNGPDDLDEVPPNIEMLHEEFIPREFEDMDQSLKERYIKYFKELYKSADKFDPRNFNESPKDYEWRKWSPKVKITRLPSDVISRYSKSNIVESETNRNTSDRNSNLSMKTRSNKERSPRTTSTNSSIRELAVSLKRLSPEEICESPKSFDTEKEIQNLVDVLVPKRKIINNEDNQKTNSETQQKTRRSLISPHVQKINSEKQQKRRSLISPIKLFDEVFPNTNVTTKEFEIFEPNKNLRTITSPSESIEVSGTSTKISASTANEIVLDQTSKRSFIPKDIAESLKIRKLEVNNNKETVTIDSRPSLSSVADWLDRHVATESPAEDGLGITVQCIIEKLETTSTEMDDKRIMDFLAINETVMKELNADKKKILEQLKTYKKDREDSVKKNKELVVSIFRHIAESDAKNEEQLNTLEQSYESWDKKYQDYQERINRNAVELFRKERQRRQTIVACVIEELKEVLNTIGRQRSGKQ